MFYITNTTSVRLPYRVEEVEEDRHDQQQRDQSGKQFKDQSDEDSCEKFLKASEKLYKNRSVVIAGEIMNKQILPLKGTLSLEEAWKLTRRHQFEYFPIISSEGKLIGLLSAKEMLRKIQNQQGKKSLREVISEETLCADAKTDIQEVIKVFFHEKLEAVPIIDEHHNVVGILSRSDLLHTISKISHLKL